MWFGAGVGGTGALWYLLSQRKYRATVWTGFATIVVVLFAVVLYIQNDLIQSQQNYYVEIWTGFLIIVVILLVITLFLQNNLFRTKQKIAVNNSNSSPALEQQTSTNLSIEVTPPITQRPDEPKVYLNEKSPDEIVARIKSLKPLERDLVAERTYVGRWVRWSGTILTIDSFRLLEREGGFTVTVGGDLFVYARLQFLPTEKHLVEVLQEGDFINYEAKMTHVLGNNLYLSNVTVT